MEEKFPKKEKTLKEFRRKGEKFLISWDPEERILFLDIWGRLEKKDAEDFNANLQEFLRVFSITESLKMLINASKIVRTSHEGRRVFTELTKHSTVKYFLAVYGGGTLVRVVGRFITVVAGKKINLRFFTTAEEGLKWLKSIKTK